MKLTLTLWTHRNRFAAAEDTITSSPNSASKALQATGFAFGLDRLIESIKSISKEPERPRVDVIVSGATDEVRSNVEGTAQEIRLHGIRAEIDLMRRGLKETLSIAEKINVPYVVIVVLQN